MKVTSAPREWSVPMGRWAEAKPTTGPDGDVYVSSIHHRVFRLSGEDGHKIWESDIGNDLYLPPQVTANGTVLIDSRGVEGSKPGNGLPEIVSLDETIALDSQGHEKWRVRTGDGFGFRLFGSRLIGVDHDGKVQARNADSGEILWQWDQPVKGYDFWLEQGAGGHLYRSQTLGGGAEELHCIDPATGQDRWSFVGGNLRYGISHHDDGTLTAISTKWGEGADTLARTIHHLDANTGEQLWKIDATEAKIFRPYFNDGVLVAEIRQDWDSLEGEAVLYNPDDGSVAWSVKVPNLVSARSTPAGKVLLQTVKTSEDGAYGNNLTCHDPASGAKLWSFAPPLDQVSQIQFVGDQMLVSGYRDVPDSEKKNAILLAVNPDTGEKAWEFEAGRPISKVIPGDGVLYLTVGECRVVAIDPATGQARYEHHAPTHLQTLDQPVEGGVVAVDLDGQVTKLAPDSRIGHPGYTPAPGTPPQGGVITRMFSSFNLTEKATKDILGQSRTIMSADFDYNGTYEAWDYVLARDNDGDGKLTDADLAELPTPDYLRSLDKNGDGLVKDDEIRQARLFLWRDSDENGSVSADDFIFPALDHGDALVDLERMKLSQRYASACE
ncbi:MAG: PQQ-binding-like beta-propeller repeat protein [Candidatus Eremiobacteraeota bacterium]|nr:PQQ-binding-like beta-propeller repeat protein [Candidatus Eremiobacteraeota bacterium]